MMKWSAFYLQDSYNVTSEWLNNLMDWVTVMMLSVFVSVVWFYSWIVMSKTISNYLIESQVIEFSWTSAPLIILYSMATISMKALYNEESQTSSPCLNLHVTGHQWYWEYSYPDFSLSFDSFLQEWESSMYRLAECDNRVVLPINATTQISVTSADVIHSWAVPSLGIKMDATPGRIIMTTHTPVLPGIVYGLCAELCGANHSFMPITIEHTSLYMFKNWVNLMVKL